MSTKQLYDYTYFGRIDPIGVTSSTLKVSTASCLVYHVFSVVGLGAFVIVWLSSVSGLGDHAGVHLQLLCVSACLDVWLLYHRPSFRGASTMWGGLFLAGVGAPIIVCVSSACGPETMYPSVSDGGVHPGGVMRLVDSIM